VKLVRKLNTNILGRSSVYLAGNIAQKLSVFLLIPVYTHYFTTDEFGIWGLAIVLMQVLSIVMKLGIPASFARYYFQYFQEKEFLNNYIKTSYYYRIVSIVCISILLYIFGDIIWYYSTNNYEFYPYYYLVLLMAIGEAFLSYFTKVYQVQERPYIFSITLVSLTTIQLFLSILFVVHYDMGVIGALYGYLIGLFIFVTYMMIEFNYKNIDNNASINSKYIIQDIKFGVPLIPHEISSWARNAFDRVIMAQFLTLSAIGIYQLGFKIGMIMSVLITSLDLAYSPFFYKMKSLYGEKSHKLFIEYSLMYTIILGAISVFISLYSVEIIYLVAPIEYEYSAKILPLIILAMFFYGQYTLYVKSIFYHKRTKLIPLLTGIPTILSIIANFVLIPIYGLIVAAWIFVISMLVTLFVVYKFSQKTEQIEYKLYNITLINFTVGITCILSSYYIYSFGTSAFWIIIKLLIVIIYMIININNIMNSFSEFMKIDKSFVK